MDNRIKENVISIYDVEAFVSATLDKAKEKAAKEKSTNNPLERLVNATDKHVHLKKDTLIMALFATIVAFSGLFLDNVVIVIGAMLLSPLARSTKCICRQCQFGKAKKSVS